MISRYKQYTVISKLALSAAILTNFLIFCSPASAKSDPNAPAVRRKPVEKFQIVSFQLIDGSRISGRLVNNDPGGLEISQVLGSQIKLQKYYRSDISPRTIVYRPISSVDYWKNTGNYFLEKVGDFNDDPDEFIQAIRCYENARATVANALGPDHELVAELDRKIQQIKTEMNNWVELVKPRAEMRKLESLATLDTRLDDIQQQLQANAKDISQMQSKINVYAAMSQDYDKLAAQINQIAGSTSSLQQRFNQMENNVYNTLQYYRNMGTYYYYRQPHTEDHNRP